jgi:hypothetical protein
MMAAPTSKEAPCAIWRTLDNVRQNSPLKLALLANNVIILDHLFSIAPMMEWTDRAEKRSVIST